MQLKKWQDAFKAKGLNPKELPDVSMIPAKYRKSVIAQYVLNVVVEFLNDGWIPDYTNHDQYKYEIWWKVEADKKHPSGFGLSLDGVDYWCTITIVGVHLCFKSRELAKYAAEHPSLKKFWEDLYLNK